MLIFSQMTKMLDLLHSYLEERGHSPARIDGSIPWQERQVRISQIAGPRVLRYSLCPRDARLPQHTIRNLFAAGTPI